MNLSELNMKSIPELIDISNTLNIDASARMRKKELVFSILKETATKGIDIYGDGILERFADGFGFLRSSDSSYFASPEDLYIASSFIRKYNLKTGDSIFCKLRVPREKEKYFAVKEIQTVNYDSPEIAKTKISFENLTAEFPKERLKIEQGNGTTQDIMSRIIDLSAPIGKGQRGLIVAPPKTGKTVMMQNIADSIAKNHPECHLIVLLIDERPEEVTEMKRSVRGEVLASTFDEPANRHVQLAELVIEKAKRLVEHKQDVVILLDSITRLARAYNTMSPSSGRVLSGGVEANALQKPKRFFGAARNTSEGGSLTIIATALIETGSKMDDVIFEEFKGTGNMELHLDRKISEKRIYPAIHLEKSGTRRDDLLLTPEELKQNIILRKSMHDRDESSVMEFLIKRLKASNTNKEFFNGLKRS